ncbi:MAG TPA: tetratricopeptide repeat protein [Gemmataceae bacterium]
MNNKGRLNKVLVIATVTAVGLGAGITASRVFFEAGAEQLLSKAESAYAKGSDAINGGDVATAAVRFDEANLQANKSLDALIKERQKASEEKRAKLEPLEGRILWLKMRALRDLYVAKGISEGHPLPQASDTISGAKFYPVLAIPDDATRQDAFTCLREAARRLTADAQVQRQALLTELMLPVPDWNIIEKTARQAIQIDSQEPWGLYLLARYDFEQPPGTGRRNRSRVLQARKYIERLKASGKYPVWRTLYLEAQITQSLLDDVQSNSNRRETEEKAVRTLLFAPGGAVARAAAGEGLEHPGKWDVEGVLGLHLMALTLAVEDSRKPPEANGGTPLPSGKVVELLQVTLSLCRQLADKEAGFVPLCGLSVAQALTKAEPVLLSEPPSDWKQDLNFAQDLVRKARDQKASNPLLYETIAGLLSREAHIEGKRGDWQRRTELNKQSLYWIEEGLRLGKEAKVPADKLLALNAAAAEMLTVIGGKSEQIRVYLSALRESKTPRPRVLAELLEASVAEREGRLVHARKNLEQVLASGEPDLAVRAHMMLGIVYLGVGQPEKALYSLQQVVQAYKAYDDLSPQERAWALEFIRGPEELALLMVRAHLDSALKQLRSMGHRNPGKPAALDAVRHHENAIAELRKRFQNATPHDREARQMMAVYYAATQRRNMADRELTELRKNYPNSVDVLRTEVAVIPSPGDAEKRIEQFIKVHPGDVDVRFFKVEWLIRMKRIDEALAYLQSPTNFTDTKSERYQRVLAATLLTKGDRPGSQRVLEQLPRDAATDALLIQTASAADREKLVRQALARYEDKALFQSWQAVLAFDKGDYATAAEAFLRVSQYSRYEAAGRRALLQSLLALSQTDPSRARDVSVRLHKEEPDESVLLLASAYADMKLDEIGTPDDKPDPDKSMAAALNAWEELELQRQPQAKSTAPLTKSIFWGLAGRQDLALAEAVRAANANPNDPISLVQTISLALEIHDPDLRPATRKRLDALRKILPNNLNVQLLEARFAEWNEEPNKALTIYKDVLGKDAKRNEAYTRLINLSLNQGDKEKAWEFVKQWRKEQPEAITAVQAEVRLLAERDEPEKARELAETLVRSHADRKSEGSNRTMLDLQLQMITALMQGKAWRQAEDWLMQLVAKNPDDVTLLARLGDVYISQSSWDKARAVYEKALAKNKHQPAVANNLAWLLAKHFDNPSEALRVIQEARKGSFSRKPISADRLRPELLDTLGVVYTKMGKGSLYPEMRDLFEDARQRFPHDPRMYLYLGHAYAGLLETDRANRFYGSAAEVAAKTGRQFLSPEKCQEVIAEAKAAQKKLKETAELP